MTEAIEGTVVDTTEVSDDSTEWVTFAVAHGIDREKAEKLTKGEILAELDLTDDDVTIFEHAPFRISEKVGLMALMQLGHHAKNGVDSNDFEGLAAMYALLEQCIATQDWERFQQHALDTRSDGETMFRVTQDVLVKLNDRPTKRPSGTSDGSPATSPNSTGDSSSRVIHRLEDAGRPDLALLVTQKVESQAS